jgi:predicted permease
MSSLSGLGFGMVPALRASRLDLSRSLTGIGRATVGSSRARLRQVLIVAEIALATMLLVGAALLLQAFVRLQQVPLGFEPEGVLTARISLPAGGYPDARRAGEFYEQLIASLEGSEQFSSVAVGTSAPFAPGVRASFALPDRVGGRSVSESAVQHIVSGNYFHVLRVPLLAGRSFNQRDDSGSPPVAIVSQRLATMLWPDRSPLGRTLERDGRVYEVVGMVGDIRGSDGEGPRGGGPEREPRAAAYFAAGQSPERTMTVVVRPAGTFANASASVRQAVRQLDPTLALPQARPLRDWFAESLDSTRFTTTLATIFTLCALLLTSVGIYGVLAYIVGSRTREIGVRMAMGATPRNIIALVLREGMTWAGTGILLGLIGAFTAVELIATLVYNVPVRDPFTFTAAGCAVAFVALMACVIPAARALLIDPTIAIRTE